MKKIVFLLCLIMVLRPTLGQVSQDEVFANYLWFQIRLLSPPLRPKVGLVLSGGGARGLAHIGVLKVLNEQAIPIDLIVGTSVGALIGALYAAGGKIEELERMAQDIGWDELVDVTASPFKLISLTHIVDAQKMEDYIAQRIQDKRFDQLKIPFACVAADILTGERIIFREGAVAPAVRASASIPGIFVPARYRHRILVDGGIVDNVPVDVARLMGADIVICSVTAGKMGEKRLKNILGILSQVIQIQGRVNSEARIGEADVVIRPDVGDVGIMDLGRSRECQEKGELACRAKLADLKSVIMDKGFQRILEK